MVDRIKAVRRDAYPSKLYWECSDTEYGRNSWLEILVLDSSLERADWHKDYNSTLTDDRITIGFMADRAWEGEGVRVESLSDSETSPAIQMKLKSGDLVIGMDGNRVTNMADLATAKSKTKRGNPMIITVNRGGDKLDLRAEIPAVVEYEAFPRSLPSGAIEAIRVGNYFYIKTSRVGKFVIYLHPKIIKFNQPVSIYVNNNLIGEHLISPNSKLLLDEFLKGRDRSMLWVGKFVVNFEPSLHIEFESLGDE